MNDEITSDSDYDNPYTETALDWHHRSLQRLARRRCGLESSSSDESLDDLELNEYDNADGDFGDTILSRWVDSYPLIAARCSLFTQPQSGRRSVRDQEAKSLRRLLRKVSGKGNEKSNDANVSSEEMKYHQLVANSIVPKGLGVSFVDAALSRSVVVKQPPVGGQQQKKTLCQTVLEMVSEMLCSKLSYCPLLLKVIISYLIEWSGQIRHDFNPNRISSKICRQYI